MNRLAVIVPVHNEVEFLPFVLAPLVRIDADEFIFVLDRSSNECRSIIGRFMSVFNFDYKIVEIPECSGFDFKFRVAYVKWWSLFETECDYVLLVDADTVLDDNVVNHWIPMMYDFDMICFGRYDVPVNVRQMVRKPFVFWMIDRPSPIQLFDRKFLLSCIDLIKLRDLVTGVDFYFHRIVDDLGCVRFVDSKSLHLRPKTDKVRRFEYGVNAYVNNRRSFFRAFFSCLISLDFVWFKGYLKARYG